jgi:TRAP-type mannitol/chloroaromatic compound transport system substrate-binding protein/gas vesicle protein
VETTLRAVVKNQSPEPPGNGPDAQGDMVRNAIIGIVIGLVIGVVVGATVVAPRLNQADRKNPAIGIISDKPPRYEKSVEVALAPLKKSKEVLQPLTSENEDKDNSLDTGKDGDKTAEVAETILAETEPEKPKAKPELAEPAAKAPPLTTEVVEVPPSIKKQTPSVVEIPAPIEALPPKTESLKPIVSLPPIIPPHDHPPIPGPTTIHWKMASAYASSLPQLGTLAKKLDRDIWRVSDGLLEIKFHEPGALVPPLEMFDAVRAGVIDAAFSSPGFWSNKLPALQLFAAVPFGPSAEEFLAWIYFGGGQELFNEIYNANGIHSIFCGLIAPEAAGWFRRRIRTIEDMKGLKMRFFGLGAKVVRKLGVITSQLTSGNIYMAFESGEIDAAEFSMPAIDLKLGLHRMIKNYYFPGWHQPSTLFELMINLKKWETLPTSAKAQIEAVCGDNIRHGLAEGSAVQFKALKILQNEGVAIRRWPGEILDALKSAWVQVAKDEAKADRDFKRVWQSLSAFRENYAIWRELSSP